MGNARGPGAVAALLVAGALAGLLTSCRKKAAVDADADVDAALAADARAAPDASTQPSSMPVPSAAVISTDGPPLRPVPSAASAGPLFADDRFSGHYQCPKGNLALVQSGTVVRSTVRTNATTDTVVVCTVAGGDVCTGSVREIQTIRGKPPKVLHVKSMTLTRTPSGDMLMLAASADPKEHPALCRKH